MLANADIPSTNTTFKSPQMQHHLDENYNADYLDALADLAYQQCQAMMESDQSQWTLINHDYDPAQDQTIEST